VGITLGELYLNQELIFDVKINGFSYEFLREEIIQDILGKDVDEILYWTGKNLARKYNLESFEAIVTFFKHSGFGELEILKEKKDNFELKLTSPLIEQRFKDNRKISYYLEAGFLAQSIELQRKCITETTIESNARDNSIRFIVKWDAKDNI
jgi:predicted hydrocarbon binding protein